MSRRTLTRFAVPATLVTACALIASGCSSGDSGPNASAPSSFKTVAQINAHPVSDLKQGGNLNYPISQVVANYNYDDVNGASVDLNNIYEASMPTPEKADADGSVHTDTDYFTSIDSATVNGKFTVTYNINPKAKWSNGRPIDWTDLEANWNAQNGKDTTYEIAASNGYDQIESVVRGANDQQAVVTYTKPYSDWQGVFAPLLARENIDTPEHFNNGSKTTMPLTAGPFKVKSIEPGGKRLVFERDPAWWGAKPVLDTITYIALDSTAEIGALQSGEIDFMELGSDADAFKTAKTIADVDLRQSAGFQWRHLDFNGAKGRITADPAVRVAIQKGINRDLIAKALLGQITSKPSVLNNHMFIDGQDGFQANNGDITYNPDEAKKELDAAGWTMSGQFRKKDGKQLDLHDVLPSGTPNASQEAQIIQQNLKEIGVNLIIDTVPSDDFFEKHVQVGDFDVTQFTWEDTVFPGSAQSIYSLTPGNIQQNYGQIGSDEINNLLNEMVTTTDPTKRNQIANQADEAIWKIGFSLPLYQRPYTYATKKALANFGAPGFGDTDMTKVGWLK